MAGKKKTSKTTGSRLTPSYSAEREKCLCLSHGLRLTTESAQLFYDFINPGSTGAVERMTALTIASHGHEGGVKDHRIVSVANNYAEFLERS